MLQVSIFKRLIMVVGLLVSLSGCMMGPQLATPQQLKSVAPPPIEDNTGEYMSPYTSDGVIAEWVDKAINAKMGSAVGSAVGTYAGQKALEQVPFIGGFLGQKVGNAAGRAIAIEASGGMEFIKSSSDISFNTLDDLAVFIYANYGGSEHYQDALEATWEIYPELKQTYHSALAKASRSVPPAAQGGAVTRVAQ